MFCLSGFKEDCHCFLFSSKYFFKAINLPLGKALTASPKILKRSYLHFEGMALVKADITLA